MKGARKTTRRTASLLLRGLDRELLDIFRARAQRHGRSLQAELQLSLRREARRNFEEAAAISAAWHERLRGRRLPSTLRMLREDRSR